jgi:Methyltransferase domain
MAWNADIERYVESGRLRVPGWFGRADAILFCIFDDLQREAGIEGDILEIGAYQGRSAVLLGYLTRPGERLVVCDLFGRPATSAEEDDENLRHYAGLEQRQFMDHYLAHHPDPPELLVRPSQTLDPAELGQRFRYVHVDGSHFYGAVRGDIELTRQILVPGGLAAFDDVKEDASVTAAVWRAVGSDGLVPICLSDKMYSSWDLETASYMAGLRRRLAERDDVSFGVHELGEGTLVDIEWWQERRLRRRAAEALVPPVFMRLLSRAVSTAGSRRRSPRSRRADPRGG